MHENLFQVSSTRFMAPLYWIELGIDLTSSSIEVNNRLCGLARLMNNSPKNLKLLKYAIRTETEPVPALPLSNSYNSPTHYFSHCPPTNEIRKLKLKMKSQKKKKRTTTKK